MPSLSPGSQVLVTGGTGFVGRALCEALAARGCRVRVLARHEASGPWQACIAADIGGDALPPDVFAGVEVVFHLAGRAHATAERAGDEALYRRDNVAGTRAVVEAAVAAGVRGMVLASSVKAMGEGDDVLRDEEALVDPETPYGLSKLAAERIVLAAADRMHVAVLRLPLVYGPGVGGNLRRMLVALRRGRMPPLALPHNDRSMVDVRDVATAALLAATHEAARGRVYLVTDGESYATSRVESAMRAALGLPAPRWRLPFALLRLMALAGDAGRVLLRRRLPVDSPALRALSASARYDGGRLRRELGFEPRWTLEAALPDMVAALDAPGGRP